ncbi:MAG: class I SAM-dependent methyltransferase [Candidatus Sungbacteria bacterium]|nr:class I SAM-dependent methyltransferase [Candidatus Sungbacteria bacterium]
MKESVEQIKTKEAVPKHIIVELGPGDRPLVWRLSRDGKARYKARGETLFNVNPGDTFFAVDLPPDESLDVFRFHIQKGTWDPVEQRMKSHLLEIKEHLNKFLPKGAKGEVLHADGQRLPFIDGQVDVLFMSNVIGGHIRGDELGGFKANQRRILREKQNLIKEAKRVLKTGGKLILEEEYAPAENVKAAWKKVVEDLKNDPDFTARDLFDNGNGVPVLELTKKELDQDPSIGRKNDLQGSSNVLH